MDFLQDMPNYMWILVAAFMGLSIFLTILWIIVPFSIIGVKPLLKDMCNKLEVMEAHLERMAAKDSDKPPEVMTEFVEGEGGEPPPMPM
jgi:hypothetical protein